MGTIKNKKSILNSIDKIELELLKSSPGYAREYLVDEGFNVEKVEEQASLYMKKISFLARASLNKEKELNLIEVALKRVKKIIADNANESSESLRFILQQRAPSVQFRKIENWSDEEIKDVLADVDLIRLMEELDS